MASDYIRMVEKQAKKKLQELNKSQQEAVIDAYRYAGRQLANGYKGSRDNTATKALYASYTKKIAEETQAIIEEYSFKGARVYMDVEKLIMTQAFQQAGLDTSLVNDKFENIIGKLGMESAKNVIGGGIYKDGAGLSSRIWQSAKISGRGIQEVVAAGLAQDMSAVKMSKMLQEFVNPTARKNWSNDKIKSILGDGYAAWNKNLEYNALRLARTTLAHTATMSMRQAKKVNPYATKIKWHSVHAAGRTCSTCEEMDGNIYKTEECPFDHPNGMCYQTHEMEKSLDEIADELAAWCNGAENEMLDNWWKGIGGTEEEKPKLLLSLQYLKEHLDSLRENMGTRNFTKSRYDDFIKYLDKCSNDYKMMWLNNADSLSIGGTDGHSAYYMPWTRAIFTSFKHEIEQAASRDYNPYHVFAHEFGHHVDNMMGKVSASKEFLEAIQADKKMILGTYGKIEMNDDFYNVYGDCSRGVQDAMEGLGIGRFRWGHGERYWNRGDRDKEVASELFANMSSACMSADEMEVMQKYFPKATEQFLKILAKGAK